MFGLTIKGTRDVEKISQSTHLNWLRLFKIVYIYGFELQKFSNFYENFKFSAKLWNWTLKLIFLSIYPSKLIETFLDCLYIWTWITWIFSIFSGNLNFRLKIETEHSNQCFSQFTHPNWFKLSPIAHIYGLELLEFFQFFLKILKKLSNFDRKFLSPSVKP